MRKIIKIYALALPILISSCDSSNPYYVRTCASLEKDDLRITRQLDQLCLDKGFTTRTTQHYSGEYRDLTLGQTIKCWESICGVAK